MFITAGILAEKLGDIREWTYADQGHGNRGGLDLLDDGPDAIFMKCPWIRVQFIAIYPT